MNILLVAYADSKICSQFSLEFCCFFLSRYFSFRVFVSIQCLGRIFRWNSIFGRQNEKCPQRAINKTSFLSVFSCTQKFDYKPNALKHFLDWNHHQIDSAHDEEKKTIFSFVQIVICLSRMTNMCRCYIVYACMLYEWHWHRKLK